MPDRFYLGDTHVHSSQSDGRLSPEELALIGTARGLDFLALTDHADARGARAYPDSICILPGEEISAGGRIHFALLGFDSPLGRFRLEKLPEIARQVHAAGGAVVLAHPWMAFSRSPDRLPLLDRGFAEGHIDGVEVFSAALTAPEHGTWERMFQHFLAVWAPLRPAVLASSDWHRRAHGRAVGQACTYVLAPDLSPASLVRAIAARRTVAALMPATALEDNFGPLPFPSGSGQSGMSWRDNLCGPADLVGELCRARSEAERRIETLRRGFPAALSATAAETVEAARAACAAGNYRRALALLDQVRWRT